MDLMDALGRLEAALPAGFAAVGAEVAALKQEAAALKEDMMGRSEEAPPWAIHGFRYGVGDVLTLEALLREPAVTTDAPRLTVVSCHLEVCSGGVQRAYSCRASGVAKDAIAFNNQLVHFHEHELAPYPDPEWFHKARQRRTREDIEAFAKAAAARRESTDKGE